MKKLRLFIALYLALIALCLLFSTVHAENQIILKGGYHVWSESGHTFTYSDVSDKEFNGMVYGIEYIYFPKDCLGISVSYVNHDKVTVEIFDGYTFVCKVSYLTLMPKYRKRLSPCLDFLGGVGLNLYFNNLSYNNVTEKRTSLGWSSSVALMYRLTKKWGLMGEVQYNRNRCPSSVYPDTNWHTGGLYMFGGVGYEF